MKLFHTNLPLLGDAKIHFHNESRKFFDFFEEKEFSRLDRIAHLGPSTIAFSGINHTRLEYTLLQCAIIELIGKVHKDDANISISNSIKIDGFNKPISSGQELLKIWALLSSAGRMQWTYGTERTLMNLLYDSNDSLNWYLHRVRNRDLKNWARDSVSKYEDYNFHYVNTIKRLYLEKPYDRSKTFLLQCLRNFLFDEKFLLKNDSVAQFKLYNLKRIYSTVRLLSIVSLDSYYSHYPIRFQLSSAINSIGRFLQNNYSENNLLQNIKNISGGLAEELYFSTSSTTIQLAYEEKYQDTLKKRIAKVGTSREKKVDFLNNLLFTGLGKPRKDRIYHLLRLKFSGDVDVLGEKNKYELKKFLERIINQRGKIFISVEPNYNNNVTYVDIKYLKGTSLSSIAKSVVSLKDWIIGLIDQEIEQRYKELYSLVEDNQKDYLRDYLIDKSITKRQNLFSNLLPDIASFLLPDGWNLVIKDYIPSNDLESPINIKININDEIKFDSSKNKITELISNGSINPDRKQELMALQRVINYSRADINIYCFEKIIISDSHGKSQDEWDGVVLKIDQNSLSIEIIEAKNIKGGNSKIETSALKQLNKTKELLSKEYLCNYRKKRIKGLGAKLVLNL